MWTRRLKAGDVVQVGDALVMVAQSRGGHVQLTISAPREVAVHHHSGRSIEEVREKMVVANRPKSG